MSSDSFGFLSIGSFLFGFSELFDEPIISLMDAMGESSALPGLEHLNEGGHREVDEFLQFNASVDLLLEGLLSTL